MRSAPRFVHKLAVVVVFSCTVPALAQACKRGSPSPTDSPVASASSVAAEASSTPVASVSAPPSASASQPVPVATSCPDGMILIPGAVSSMGTDFDPDEAPRHQVAVKSFCLDKTEVTVAVFKQCVADGKCKSSHKGMGCTEHAKGNLDDHPMTCVDWTQASESCAAFGKRLPTEREWEFAAAGGTERRRFSWGTDDPQGRSCYNNPSTCKVGSYPPGAFGLLDMTGNVWEWTSSWFGSYPDEAESGHLKVYRGGSYSRRYPRWMRNGLRNRFKPDEWGAHLGFRCATELSGAACPQGSHDEGGKCEVDGYKKPPKSKASYVSPEGSAGAESAPPAVSRDARFDEDCRKYKPGRPTCYMIRGGSFADRQRISGSRGCVNRDVGVGYNSICCKE